MSHLSDYLLKLLPPAGSNQSLLPLDLDRVLNDLLVCRIASEDWKQGSGKEDLIYFCNWLDSYGAKISIVKLSHYNPKNLEQLQESKVAALLDNRRKFLLEEQQGSEINGYSWVPGQGVDPNRRLLGDLQTRTSVPRSSSTHADNGAQAVSRKRISFDAVKPLESPHSHFLQYCFSKMPHIETLEFDQCVFPEGRLEISFNNILLNDLQEVTFSSTTTSFRELNQFFAKYNKLQHITLNNWCSHREDYSHLIQCIKTTQDHLQCLTLENVPEEIQDSQQFAVDLSLLHQKRSKNTGGFVLQVSPERGLQLKLEQELKKLADEAAAIAEKQRLELQRRQELEARKAVEAARILEEQRRRQQRQQEIERRRAALAAMLKKAAERRGIAVAPVAPVSLYRVTIETILKENNLELLQALRSIEPTAPIDFKKLKTLLDDSFAWEGFCRVASTTNSLGLGRETHNNLDPHKLLTLGEVLLTEAKIFEAVACDIQQGQISLLQILWRPSYENKGNTQRGVGLRITNAANRALANERKNSLEKLIDEWLVSRTTVTTQDPAFAILQQHCQRKLQLEWYESNPSSLIEEEAVLLGLTENSAVLQERAQRMQTYCRQKFADCLKRLLLNHTVYGKQNAEGDTLLHIAARFGNSGAMVYMLRTQDELALDVKNGWALYILYQKPKNFDNYLSNYVLVITGNTKNLYWVAPDGVAQSTAVFNCDQLMAEVATMGFVASGGSNASSGNLTPKPIFLSAEQAAQLKKTAEEYPLASKENLPFFDLPDNAGNTPMHHLIKSSQHDLVFKLIGYGADIRLRNHANVPVSQEFDLSGDSLLHCALKRRAIPLFLKWVANEDIDVMVADASGKPLWDALIEKQSQLAAETEETACAYLGCDLYLLSTPPDSALKGTYKKAYVFLAPPNLPKQRKERSKQRKERLKPRKELPQELYYVTADGCWEFVKLKDYKIFHQNLQSLLDGSTADHKIHLSGKQIEEWIVKNGGYNINFELFTEYKLLSDLKTEIMKSTHERFQPVLPVVRQQELQAAAQAKAAKAASPDLCSIVMRIDFSSISAQKETRPYGITLLYTLSDTKNNQLQKLKEWRRELRSLDSTSRWDWFRLTLGLDTPQLAELIQQREGVTTELMNLMLDSWIRQDDQKSFDRLEKFSSHKELGSFTPEECILLSAINNYAMTAPGFAFKVYDNWLNILFDTIKAHITNCKKLIENARECQHKSGELMHANEMSVKFSDKHAVRNRQLSVENEVMMAERTALSGELMQLDVEADTTSKETTLLFRLKERCKNLEEKIKEHTEKAQAVTYELSCLNLSLKLVELHHEINKIAAENKILAGQIEKISRSLDPSPQIAQLIHESETILLWSDKILAGSLKFVVDKDKEKLSEQHKKESDFEKRIKEIKICLSNMKSDAQHAEKDQKLEEQKQRLAQLEAEKQEALKRAAVMQKRIEELESVKYAAGIFHPAVVSTVIPTAVSVGIDVTRVVAQESTSEFQPQSLLQ